MENVKHLNEIIKNHQYGIKVGIEDIKDAIFNHVSQHLDHCEWSDNNILVTDDWDPIVSFVLEELGLKFYIFNCELFEDNALDNSMLEFKEPSEFSLETFKEELVEEFDEVKLIGNTLTYNRYTLMTEDGNVNFSKWHNGYLNEHDFFKFHQNPESKRFIDSFEKAKEFKKVLQIYFKHIDGLKEAVLKCSN